jgi:hypothetical protein
MIIDPLPLIKCSVNCSIILASQVMIAGSSPSKNVWLAYVEILET